MNYTSQIINGWLYLSYGGEIVNCFPAHPKDQRKTDNTVKECIKFHKENGA